MPLFLIRQDITKIECDAIVNATNSTLLGGGGVDGAIHKAAGEELLNECKTLGGCACGEAKITKGYALPCKYVIHTVGPIWQGGNANERAFLESCYKNSLALAKKHGCETVAFPLISSGVYGYPKDKALSVAVQTISEFLFHNEMTVYVVVYDKQSFEISKNLYENVSEYIADNYIDSKPREYRRQIMRENNASNEIPLGPFEHAETVKTQSYSIFADSDEDFDGELCTNQQILSNELPFDDLDDMLAKLSDNFAVSLLKLIDEKGYSDVECYKKANVAKQTWYKIMNEKNYKPSKNTVISFAIALELSLQETQALLATVGYTLSRSNKFDVIIEYFLLNEEYNVFTINETLFKFDQPCLGV